MHRYPTVGLFQKLLQPLNQTEVYRFISIFKDLVAGEAGDSEGALTLLLAARISNDDSTINVNDSANELIRERLLKTFGSPSRVVLSYEAQNVGFDGMFLSPISAWVDHFEDFWFRSSDDWVIIDLELKRAAIIWHWGSMLVGEIGEEIRSPAYYQEAQQVRDRVRQRDHMIMRMQQKNSPN